MCCINRPPLPSGPLCRTCELNTCSHFCASVKYCGGAATKSVSADVHSTRRARGTFVPLGRTYSIQKVIVFEGTFREMIAAVRPVEGLQIS